MKFYSCDKQPFPWFKPITPEIALEKCLFCKKANYDFDPDGGVEARCPKCNFSITETIINSKIECRRINIPRIGFIEPSFKLEKNRYYCHFKRKCFYTDMNSDNNLAQILNFSFKECHKRQINFKS